MINAAIYPGGVVGRADNSWWSRDLSADLRKAVSLDDRGHALTTEVQQCNLTGTKRVCQPESRCDLEVYFCPIVGFNCHSSHAKPYQTAIHFCERRR